MKDAKKKGKNANIRVNIKLDKTIKNVGKSKRPFPLKGSSCHFLE